jgi:uncharacterized membrane protein YphA (DoxX/SURF4 family)
MTGSASPSVAQRRVALLLLPLRVWLGIAWLRTGLALALQPEWLDGTALTQFVEGQVDAGAGPVSLYTELLASVVERAATPLGMLVVVGQIVIGLGLLTGTLTNLALLMAILFNVNLILTGVASPSQFYIVIQVVLLVGGAGAAYSVDRSLSRYLPSVMLTGHRGLVDGVEVSRPALVVLAVVAVGSAAALVPTVDAVLPDRGVDDPGLILIALLFIVAVLAMALTRAAHRAEESEPAQFGTDDPLGVGFPRDGGPVSGPLPPPRAMPARPPADAPVPLSVPPRVRPTEPRRAPLAPQRRPEPWPSPAPVAGPAPAAAPAPSATRPGPALRDQPTTQFARPRRRAVTNGRPPADDPYAELRDLPPHHQR